jgi:putative transposase
VIIIPSHAARGIVVNGLRYGHPLMRLSRDAGKLVEVRYEPFDMSLIYAFVDGQWLPCTADAFLQVQGAIGAGMRIDPG